MAVAEANISVLNKGSLSIPNPCELVRQQMRFKIVTSDGAVAYVAGGFNVSVDGLSVVEAASVSIEGAASETKASITKIQVNVLDAEKPNNVVVQLWDTKTDLEEVIADLTDYKFVINAEGY